MKKDNICGSIGMKTVYLTSGPRGAGKTTYAEAFIKEHPEVAFVSRDEILIFLFGKTSLSPYEGGHDQAHSYMLGMLRKYLSADHPAETILLDCWNGYASERQKLIEKLRIMGADKVVCLFFHIPEQLCVEWFSKKSDVGFTDMFFADSAKRNRNLFYHHARNIEDDGFDEIVHVNSNQLSLFSS